MKTISNKNIWLIGCSSGIGYELAKLLLKHNNRLVLSARRQDNLTPLAENSNNQAQVIPCDVTDQNSIDHCVQKIQAQWASLDCVIYCAGSCIYIDDGELESNTVKQLFDSNFFGLVYVLEKTLPLLKQSKNDPYIVGVSSLSTIVPFPRAEAYGSSKAAMKYLLDSLRIDLIPFGIDVSTVSPGFVETPMTANNNFPMPWIINSEQAALKMLVGMRKRKKDINFPKRLSFLLHLAGVLRPLWLNILAPKLHRTETGGL